VATPEYARQLKKLLSSIRISHRLQHQMAEEESKVHGRIAKVGGFVVHEREWAVSRERMDQEVLGTEITVAQCFLDCLKLFDERGDGCGGVRQALADALIERRRAQLMKNGSIAELLGQLRAAGSPFMDEAEHQTRVSRHRRADLAV